MITLADYIDILLPPWGDYVQMNVPQTRLVEDNGPLPEGYIMESFSDTLFPNSHIVLPPLTLGEKRLWFRHAWEKFNGPEAKNEHKKWVIKQMLREHLLQ